MFDDILVYVPEKETFIIIAEGTGDNLLPEDMDEGYVDYINYYTFDKTDIFEENAFYDCGGMIMYKELIQEKFTDIRQVIPEVLFDIFEQKGINFIVL